MRNGVRTLVMLVALATAVGCRHNVIGKARDQAPTERDAGAPAPDHDNDVDSETGEGIQRNLGG